MRRRKPRSRAAKRTVSPLIGGLEHLSLEQRKVAEDFSLEVTLQNPGAFGDKTSEGSVVPTPTSTSTTHQEDTHMSREHTTHEKPHNDDVIHTGKSAAAAHPLPDETTTQHTTERLAGVMATTLLEVERLHMKFDTARAVSERRLRYGAYVAGGVVVVSGVTWGIRKWLNRGAGLEVVAS